MVFTEFERCECKIGFLVPTSERGQVKCSYCSQTKIVIGTQELLKFDSID